MLAAEWHGAALGNARKLPKLSSLLGEAGERRMTDKEIERRFEAWANAQNAKAEAEHG